MREESLEFLKKLLTTPSPSGYESRGQRIWCEYARKFADEVRTDAYGNAVAVLNPDGDPKIMLDGHADEIGLMVKHIDEKGFIYFQRIGGVDPALVRGKRVNIHTAKGIVCGVTGATAIHLRKKDKDEPKAPKMHELFIDIGASGQKAAARKVAVGDPITFADDFEVLNGSVAVARAFDNRVGTWTVIEALRMVAEKKKQLKCAIYACSAVQEELGLHGAAMNVENVRPDAAVAVDVTHSTDTPGIDLKQHGEIKLGKGPTVSLGRENHPVVVHRLRSAAKKKKINLQTETFSLTGGTNALAIYAKRGGVPSAIVGIPNRYMHTTVEMIDLKDLQRTAELLAAFCADVKKGERFKVEV
ncbi:MAG: M42 family metallopeptidase [Phycisphaerae bacterium]|nr:M42 family metallopeptidase [Phycisphaerae bacterium]